MNKNQYRLVFSRVRGMLVAAEETAHATGKVSKGEAPRSVANRALSALASFALRHAAFAVLIAAGVTPMWASAQVVGAGANAPSVIQTQNGLQQVNITKPSGAGVSLNTYSQFDVPKQGVIVNNSPTLTNTQQAGYINGNPNLSPNGAARIIINQVNSNNPSQLKGYVEIAGQRAEMIISNSSGLVVDGGGFINTSRAILTTGTPNLNADGSLAGFNVTRGLITVQGAGLTATNVDQVDLISRAVQANAAIYASNLNVVAGANQVNHETLQATRIQGDGPAPAVAIDVGQLGGMYSNRIFLVGTEGGVGVRNAGTIAADAMGLTLTTDGRLVQAGKISSVGNVAVSAAGGIENSGTTYAQQSVSLNTGADVANNAAIKTGGNFQQNAGNLSVGGNLGMNVGGDWILGAVQTGEHKIVQRANGVSNTDINNAVGSSVKVGGQSSIGVGGDVTARGAQIDLGQGGTIAAKGTVTLGAASATSAVNSNSSGSDSHGSYAETLHTSDQALTGTMLKGGDTITLASGKDITISGSAINLDKGNADLLAKGDVNVGAATETHTFESHETHSHSNVVSGVKVASGTDQTATYSKGSTISADGITVESGRDINVTGSNIVGTNDVSLDAARNVNITTSQDTVQSSSYYDKKESGLLTNGGLSVTFGSRSMGQTDQSKQVTNNASVVGASSGNVSISAGKDATITSSTVVAGQNLDVTGQNVAVNSAYDTYNDAQSQHFSQSGLSVGVNGGVVGLAQSMASTVRQGVQSGDSRLAAVQGVAAAEQAYQSRDGLKNAATALSSGKVSEAANGVQVQLSIGSSHSSSNETTSITQAKNSSLIGNGNVHVTATGTPDANGNAQPGTGDITMTGANVLGKNVSLDANNAITLQSAQSTERETSSNSSSGWNAGVGIGVGKQTGISVFANGTNSHGQGNGSAVTQTNTTIAAGNTLVMKSGGDTTLAGAQVSGDKVKADVGGNLTMTSVQDTSNYASNQHSAGASGSFTFGYGGGAELSIGHTGIDANYASVDQQTGIVAGKGGFDVSVANHTQLNGAQIASAAPAESNTLTTGSLGFRDIQNSMSYSASSEGFSTSSGPSFAHTGDSASGVTKAAVSPGTITVKSGQQNGTDSTAGLSRDTANANQTVKNTFNLQQTQNDLAFAQAFGKAATFAVAEAATQLENSSPQMKALFGEGGAGRDALHAAVAAIGAALSGGNIGGAVAGSLAGDALQSLAQPIIDQAVSQLPLDAQAAARKALNEVVATAGGAAGGALAGGGSSGMLAGAGAAANNELYNRQLHPTERQWISDNATRYAKQQGITVEQAISDLTAQANRQVQNGSPGAWDQTASAFLNQAHGLLPADGNSGPGYMFYATPDQKANVAMYAKYYPNGVGMNVPSAQAVASSANRDKAQQEKYSTLTSSAAAVAALVTGGVALFPDVATAIGSAIKACASNPVLCGNQAAIAVGDLAAGGAMPAGTGAAVAGAGAAAAGKLIGSTENLTAAERGFVNEMVSGGRTVEVIPSSNVGRSGDFLIDGKKYELKTMTNVVKQDSDGLSKAISSTAMDARGQSGDIIIDARNQAGMTPEIAQRGIGRAYSRDTDTGAKIQSITVITPQGTVYVPRLPK
ncbi:hemagglutinin repeat-containing protein [Burkholderia pseudomallei]|uniref:hemagglutinin repeat-containing protein n=1 Tax=Burkholderia pseudomallei TaxID=28450 RepID=UPI000E6A4B7A|nr:hemagglutinin repeat-containing protein [Burkholderia pseudomallei]RIV67359.1 filamentous hemagglutinin N-terminal domain-containing protein [Burkholderia pseudomallei]RIV81849.1 filamentous hemagglutinin N-terminal domain-containing protein [Burkholderia pseudomallei]